MRTLSRFNESLLFWRSLNLLERNVTDTRRRHSTMGSDFLGGNLEGSEQLFVVIVRHASGFGAHQAAAFRG